MKKLKSEIARLVKAQRTLAAAVGMGVIVALAIFLWPKHPAPQVSKMVSLTQVKAVTAFTQPLPLRMNLDPNRVALGERLFHDVRLSGDNTVSCSTCHSLSTGGVDNRSRSVGVNGGVGDINTPTVFNSGFNFVQFWNGRAPSLEEQINGPVNHPKEMASNWPQVLGKLGKDAAYPELFARAYLDGLTEDNIRDAIATFERSLVTPNSRFDKFLRGDAEALSEQEHRGYELFQNYGCSSCHQGVNLGGNMYEKMGLMGDYFADRGHITEADKGRFNVNQLPHSMHEFRVPSLRNVALTAPYFHDGNAETLEQAITIMAKYQLARPVTLNEVQDIAAFLRTLTGEYQGKPL